MTSAEKKAYLSRYRYIDGQLDLMLRERDELRAKVERVTASVTGMPRGGGDRHGSENLMIQLAELDEAIKERMGQLIHTRADIELRIMCISNPTLETVLRLRYIDGMSWEDVAEAMHYTTRHVINLHGMALCAFEMG